MPRWPYRTIESAQCRHCGDAIVRCQYEPCAYAGWRHAVQRRGKFEAHQCAGDDGVMNRARPVPT